MKATVKKFCLALHRVCLRGGRDEQGVDGEDLWSSLEVVEGVHGGKLVEFPTTVEETVALAGSLGVNTRVLGGRLTKMPDWHRVLADDWYGNYRREWWEIL